MPTLRALARAAATGVLRRGGGLSDEARRPGLCRVRAACRFRGFSVRGFLNGTTCVLEVDGRALREACREAGAPEPRRSLCRLNIALPRPLSNPYAIGRIWQVGTVAHGPVRCGARRAARRGHPCSIS